MTQTMRERLIAKLYEALPTEGRPYREDHGIVLAGGHVVSLAGMVDVILAELREPDEAMRQIGRDYDGIGNEPALAGFTAMIDAVREGR